MFKGTRKEDLLKVALELDQIIPEKATILSLKQLIEKSEAYENDADFVKDLISTTVADRNREEEKREEEKRSEEKKRHREEEKQREIEIEKIQLEREKIQLELALAQNGPAANQNSGEHPTSNESNEGNQIENLIRSVRTLSMPVPSRPENYHLFFESLERAFTTKNVPDNQKPEILVNILGEKASQVLLTIPAGDLKDYNKVKNAVLRQFQPTPQECLHNFRGSQRMAGETHAQFSARLTSTFDYYCEIRKATDFKTLCQLMVSDKLFSTLDRETQSYIAVTQGEDWLKPQELAKKCDIYFTSKRKSFSETTNFRQNHSAQNFRSRNPNQNPFRNSIYRSSPNYQNQRYSGNNFRPDVCEIAARKNRSTSQKIFFHKSQYESVLFNGKETKALIDSGANVPCIRSSLLPSNATFDGSLFLRGAFGTEQKAPLTEINLEHPEIKVPITITVAACRNLCADLVLPPDVFKSLIKQKEKDGKFTSPELEQCQDIAPSAKENLTIESSCHHLPESSLSMTQPQLSPAPADLFTNNETETPGEDTCVFRIDCDIHDEDFSHIQNAKLRSSVKELVKHYEPRQTKSTNFRMKIFLSDETPVYHRPRRLAPSEKEEVKKQIKELLANGTISESTSDYSSPVVLCKKKDGSTRMCIDYRKLNKVIIKERFPIPLIDDIFDKLQGASVFSNLDLKNSFYQVEVDPASRKFTSFVTPDNQYEFNKVPFGLCNSPSSFQRFIQIIFRDLLESQTLIIYLDDIIVPSADEEEGVQKLKKIFQVAADYGLQFNFKKCNFLQRKITFLGHILENGKIRPSTFKTNAVLSFPQPKTAKDVQSFLGLSGYFRKFIKNYAVIARPLSDLLRDSIPFQFGPDQQQAFLNLKQALATEPVLHLYKQGSPLQLHTDASSKGFGAILLQTDSENVPHPIHYMSRKTSPQEEKYSSYELEVLAIVAALKKFRHYLVGTKFKIFTDCQAFQRTMTKKELPPRIARWAMMLEDYEYELVHRPGQQMKHVDALSRYPVMSIQVDETTQKIGDAQSKDEFTLGLKQLIEDSSTSEYKLRHNALYKIVNDQELLVVPQDMQKQVVQLEHNKGHFGINKTEAMVKQQFWFPHIRKTVENVLSNCVPCILSSRKTGKQEGYLHPIPKGDVPLDTYHIDFLGPLPSTNKNYKYIFTVVDAFTKFLWIYPVKSTSSKDALEKLKLQQITFGNPNRIISDRGSAFTSTDFKKFCEDEKIELITTTTGQPRGNGQVEKFHGTLIPVITKLSLDDPDKWFRHVPAVQRVINSTVSSATCFSPFELLTGVKMKSKDDLNIIKILEEEHVHVFVKKKQEMCDEAKKNILQLQEKSKKNYDRKRKAAKNYQVNDLVAIKRTQFGTGLKLRPKFFGPYRVNKVKSNDRYDVVKIGTHDGPHVTSTAADLMKPWSR